jgi:hypothetical protein
MQHQDSVCDQLEVDESDSVSNCTPRLNVLDPHTRLSPNERDSFRCGREGDDVDEEEVGSVGNNIDRRRLRRSSGGGGSASSLRRSLSEELRHQHDEERVHLRRMIHEKRKQCTPPPPQSSSSSSSSAAVFASTVEDDQDAEVVVLVNANRHYQQHRVCESKAYGKPSEGETKSQNKDQDEVKDRDRMAAVEMTPSTTAEEKASALFAPADRKHGHRHSHGQGQYSKEDSAASPISRRQLADFDDDDVDRDHQHQHHLLPQPYIVFDAKAEPLEDLWDVQPMTPDLYGEVPSEGYLGQSFIEQMQNDPHCCQLDPQAAFEYSLMCDQMQQILQLPSKGNPVFDEGLEGIAEEETGGDEEEEFDEGFEEETVHFDVSDSSDDEHNQAFLEDALNDHDVDDDVATPIPDYEDDLLAPNELYITGKHCMIFGKPFVISC